MWGDPTPLNPSAGQEPLAAAARVRTADEVVDVALGNITVRAAAADSRAAGDAGDAFEGVPTHSEEARPAQGELLTTAAASPEVLTASEARCSSRED
eukprot:CAMPEP_0203890908 /NCGR_PEP_ID=MMETSP0359-20131031/34277_1 /ASSEMBLY_ACC=CAM_ASM_000338 /TAXON_ID=268821 /ORGANISM="Scrippsiella Hangoei, Strain SHTV-5" /LENGTH=96 /DNA_ID=CAMNT_0050812617 /DNA_START=680 /DNA_END=970 /DNA_ORIENTATION=-